MTEFVGICDQHGIFDQGEDFQELLSRLSGERALGCTGVGVMSLKNYLSSRFQYEVMMYNHRTDAPARDAKMRKSKTFF